jgi:DNA-binding NarL/FixJ family response regulator
MSHATTACISQTSEARMEPAMLILIADDYAAVRRGLREMLADEFPGASFTEAANASEALFALANAQPSVLLLDLNMPGRSGLDLLLDIRHSYPQLPVLIVSVQPEDQYATPCLRAGAAAYINKDNAQEQLPQAVRKVLEDCDAGDPHKDSTDVGRTLQKPRGKTYKSFSVF